MAENPFDTIKKCEEVINKEERIKLLTILKGFLSIRYLNENVEDFKDTIKSNTAQLSSKLFHNTYLLPDKIFDKKIELSDTQLDKLFNIIQKSNIQIHPDIFTILFEVIQKSKNKDMGQVFTPIHITRYILKHSKFSIEELQKKNLDELKVIDPAMGYGKFIVEFYHVLEKTYAQKGIKGDIHKKIIETNIYGIDKDPFMTNLAIIYLLTIKNKDYYSKNKINLNLIEADALMQKNSAYYEGLEPFKKEILSEKFDYVLGNPPYSKKFLPKDKKYYIQTYKESIGGHPNLCTLFIHRSLQFLKENGFLGYIVAAPYTTGAYNTKIRKYILDNSRIIELLLFKDRKKTIRNVLQAVSIIILKKEKNEDNYRIKLTEINDLESLRKNNIQFALVNKDKVVHDKEHNYMFLISSNKETYNIINKIRAGSRNLIEYCKQISTGHIVNYRVKQKIFDKPVKDSFPLIDIKNIYPYFVDLRDERIYPLWYKPNGDYDERIKMSNNVILIKRMTSPEQRKRIVAGFSSFGKNNVYLGNKTNFINLKHKEEVDPYYITAVLNSKLFDFYFRKFSSNTQVSAMELRLMPIRLDINGNKSQVIELAKESRELMQDWTIKRDKSILEKVNKKQEKIDCLIFEIYGLTNDEISIMKNS